MCKPKSDNSRFIGFWLVRGGTVPPYQITAAAKNTEQRLLSYFVAFLISFTSISILFNLSSFTVLARSCNAYIVNEYSS